MVRARWSSLATVFDGTDEGTDGATVDIDELFSLWSASRQKGDFIARLPLHTAQELTTVIYERTPAHQPQPRRKERQCQ